MSRAESLVVAQARLGSTRLPGKVLMDLAGERLRTIDPGETRAIESP